MKLCLFASYTYKRKSIRVFRTPILVYLDVRGVEIPLLSTVSISNCRYQEAPGEVVWSDFLAQLPRRSIEILWHLTRPSGLVKCQRISILLLGNCARISQTTRNAWLLSTNFASQASSCRRLWKTSQAWASTLRTTSGCAETSRSLSSHLFFLLHSSPAQRASPSAYLILPL